MRILSSRQGQSNGGWLSELGNWREELAEGVSPAAKNNLVAAGLASLIRKGIHLLVLSSRQEQSDGGWLSKLGKEGG